MNRDFEQLRKLFEGGDSFMQGGHRIVHLRTRKRQTPEWTKNNVEVRKVLLRSFPKLETNAVQRNRAARWALVIHLFFRLQFTYMQVAEEMGISAGRVRDSIRSIKRAGQGLRPNGTGKLGETPRGRPWPRRDSRV